MKGVSARLCLLLTVSWKLGVVLFEGVSLAFKIKPFCSGEKSYGFSTTGQSGCLEGQLVVLKRKSLSLVNLASLQKIEMKNKSNHSTERY